MTSFDLDIDEAAVRDRIRDLKDTYSDRVEFVVGPNAEYAVHLEFGRGPVEAQDADALRFENEDGEVIYRARVSGHPPYPFVRPAVRELEAAPEAFLVKNTELDGVGDIDSTEELVESYAFALESQISKNANANRSGRSPGTHPDHPVTDTGTLVASIQAVRVA
jgi:hypothetical protein